MSILYNMKCIANHIVIGNTKAMKKRIGIYLRVSTSGQSTDLQKKEILDYLGLRNLNNWTIYEDKLTGTNTQRPSLKQLLGDVRQRKIDLVICWKLDRLFRSLKDMVTTLQDFEDLGVALISLKDQIDMTTASGRLMTHLIAAFAEFEASLIRERVMAGLDNAKRKGIKLGRPKSISDTEALRLRKTGMSLNQIAKQLGVTKGGVSKSLSKMAALSQ
jgi:putative DNA-invertase from lambdoid prophage Rac